MSFDHEQAAAVWKLISDRDRGMVEQGLQLLESLDNPELWMLVADEAHVHASSAHRDTVWLRAACALLRHEGLQLSNGADAGDERVVYRVGGVEIRMMRLPPGVFPMGSPERNGHRWASEGPQHLVRLTRGFELGVTPVTNAQWQAVMGTTPPSWEKEPNRPVTRIRAEDAVKFCARLSQVLGESGFRLPTEAEWEYACRAGSTESRYGEIDAIAWYSDNSSYTAQNVGLKHPNAWGLHDMLGNVWEWTSDAMRPYKVAWPPVVDPVFASFVQSDQVYRGGSVDSGALDVRAYTRYNWNPYDDSVSVGFRLAKSAP